MPEITIVDVDLNLDTIGVDDITHQNRVVISTIVQEQKRIQKLASDKAKAQNELLQKRQAVLTSIYNTLLTTINGKNKLTSEQILIVINGVYANVGALWSAMRQHLKDLGVHDKYIVQKVTSSKKTSYYLEEV